MCVGGWVVEREREWVGVREEEIERNLEGMILCGSRIDSSSRGKRRESHGNKKRK